MVLSVVAMSAAFAGSAAAEQPNEISASDGFDSLSDQNRYVGQQFNINDSSAEFAGQDQVYLASAASINDTGAVVELGSSIPYTNQSDSSGEFRAEDVELSVDPGTYVISSSSSNPVAANVSETFSVVEQDFGVDFDDDSIDEFDNASEVSFSAQN